VAEVQGSRLAKSLALGYPARHSHDACPAVPPAFRRTATARTPSIFHTPLVCRGNLDAISLCNLLRRTPALAGMALGTHARHSPSPFVTPDCAERVGAFCKDLLALGVQCGLPPLLRPRFPSINQGQDAGSQPPWAWPGLRLARDEIAQLIAPTHCQCDNCVSFYFGGGCPGAIDPVLHGSLFSFCRFSVVWWWIPEGAPTTPRDIRDYATKADGPGQSSADLECTDPRR